MTASAPRPTQYWDFMLHGSSTSPVTASPARPERDKTPDDLIDAEMPAVVKVAKAHGINPATLCVKWAAQRGQIPIPFSVHHFADNLECTIGDPLTDAEMAELAAADANCRLIKGQVFLWEGAKGWEDLWDMNGEITK